MSQPWISSKCITPTRTLSVTSGKGGVGKTTIVCNMAFELGRRGNKVLILDGDLGMANVDIMFGRRAPFTLGHVLESKCSLEESLIEVAPNVSLIPGGSGLYGLARLSAAKRHYLLDQVNQLNRNFDFLLVDTAPGIDDNVLYLNSAAQEILVVVTPEPTSLTDAYALIKVLNLRYREHRFSIVVNMARDEGDALFAYNKLSDVAARFLCVSLDYKGFIPSDPNLRQSIRSQQLVVQSQSRCPASLAIRGLAENVNNSAYFTEVKGGLQFFWHQISGVA